MIYKELDPPDWDQLSTISQRTADEQMPYYLRRFFGQSPEVDILNQLCVSTGGVVTQVDHLVLHPYGIVVVDSRGVSGRLQVMEDGRWMRRENRQLVDMPSPIAAAQAQMQSLKTFLDKKVRQKGFFERIEFDVVVAVPDLDAIEWPPSGPLTGVCNADQVPWRVNELLTNYRSEQGSPGLLVAEQRRRLAAFFCAKHRGATAIAQ